jgi:hypothetical protein
VYDVVRNEWNEREGGGGVSLTKFLISFNKEAYIQNGTSNSIFLELSQETYSKLAG